MSARPARRPLSRLAERVAGRLLFRRVPVQPRLVEQLRQEAAALDDGAADAIDLWERLRRELREHLRRDDPAEFLRWPPVQQTMVKRGRRRLRPQLAHLRARPDWRERWRPAVRETALGRPHPWPRYPWSSVNLIYQASHACRFEEAAGRPLASMSAIVEFGGGYGRLCHLVHDLGFRGAYVIFDLPEAAILQRFYLRHVGIPVLEAAGTTWPARGVVTVTGVDRLLALLGARAGADAAFVAIGSLSEAPLALRDTVLAAVARFDAFLVLYSAQHDGLDNRGYFARWRAALGGHAWSETIVPEWEKSAAYLIGQRR